jgi:hypothetical protein
VRELSLEGIGFLTEHRRYYPQRELAAHVLGYVGLDNDGMSGIEHAFEKEIRGRAAKVVVHTDARRRPSRRPSGPSTDGAAVTLTLDERVQHIAERELERAMAETQSQSGSVVVVEPFTGEVLAMAGRPTFNPNRYNAYPSSRWRNRSVSDAFEPGSIFKIVTAAAGDPGERRLPERDARLRQRQDRDRGHRDQRPRGVPAAHLHAGGGALERHRHDPRRAAAGARQLRALREGVRLRHRDRRRPAGRVGGALPPDGALERALAADAVVRAGDRRHRAADHDGRGGGRQRRLPDEAVRREARGGQRGRVLRETKPVVVRRVLEPATVDTLTGSCRRSCAAGPAATPPCRATWWPARPAPRRRSTRAAATR